MYLVTSTNLFKKQLRKIIRRGVSKSEIVTVIDLLRQKQSLPVKFKNHKLKGEFSGFFELHIRPDLLLVYTYHDNVLVLELIAIGSHSDLF
jgi:mRNA interferase YafQ